MVPYLTRRDILGGLLALGIVGSILGLSSAVTVRRGPSCMDVVVEHQERASRFRDELARAAMAGSQAECTAHRAYLAELEALDAKTAACGLRGQNHHGSSPAYGADLAFQRRLTASKCPSL
jgi:hypothetical protein